MIMLRMCVAFAACAALATACGEEIDDDAADDGDTTFACDRITCDSAAGEFCWFQRFQNGETHTPQCMAPATPCTTCACAAEAVAEDLDGSNNCSGLTECKQDGAAIVYSCVNPPL